MAIDFLTPSAGDCNFVREQISKKLRFQIFQRDNFTCQYCGSRPPDVRIECDHITPVAAGGSSASENLITACFGCNAGKRDNPLFGFYVPRKDNEENIRKLSVIQSIVNKKHDVYPARMHLMEYLAICIVAGAEIDELTRAARRANSGREFVDGLGSWLVGLGLKMALDQKTNRLDFSA